MISVKHSIKWVSIGQGFKLAVQFVSVMILARILSPGEYGLMALVYTVTTFVGLFRDFGTGTALIQKKELENDILRATTYLNIIIGMVLTLVVIVIAYPVSLFFSNPELLTLLILISPSIFMSSASASFYALLERGDQFKKLAFIEISSNLLALVVAIVLAMQGAGVYSLAIQSLISTGVSFLLVVLYSPKMQRQKVKMAKIKSILKFSLDNFLFNFTNYFARNLDSVFVGRYLGEQVLGIYNTAYKFLLLPLTNITYIVNKSSFPTYSRFQDSPDLIARHFLRSLQRIAGISAVIMSSLWTFRESVINLLLGEEWSASAELLIWLAPAGFIQSLSSMSGLVFNSFGRTDILRNFGVLSVPFFGTVFAIGASAGINTLAMYYFYATLIWSIPVFFFTIKLLNLRFLQLFKALYPSVLFMICLSSSFRWVIEANLINQ